MNPIWPHMGLALGTFLAMEPLVALTHRYVMHGFGWGWHRDHHLPGHRVWERNDWYAVVGALLASGLFAYAGGWRHWAWWIGFGMTLYGLLYALLHDGFVHRRWAMPRNPAGGNRLSRYLRRLIEAHHLHHAVREKEGAVSYGFLYAPPIARLRAQLRARARGCRA